MSLLCWTSPEPVGWIESFQFPPHDHMFVERPVHCSPMFPWTTVCIAWAHHLIDVNDTGMVGCTPRKSSASRNPCSYAQCRGSQSKLLYPFKKVYFVPVRLLLQSQTLVQWVTLSAKHANALRVRCRIACSSIDPGWAFWIVQMERFQ